MIHGTVTTDDVVSGKATPALYIPAECEIHEPRPITNVTNARTDFLSKAWIMEAKPNNAKQNTLPLVHTH